MHGQHDHVTASLATRRGPEALRRDCSAAGQATSTSFTTSKQSAQCGRHAWREARKEDTQPPGLLAWRQGGRREHAHAQKQLTRQSKPEACRAARCRRPCCAYGKGFLRSCIINQATRMARATLDEEQHQGASPSWACQPSRPQERKNEPQPREACLPPLLSCQYLPRKHRLGSLRGTTCGTMPAAAVPPSGRSPAPGSGTGPAPSSRITKRPVQQRQAALAYADPPPPPRAMRSPMPCTTPKRGPS